MEASHLWAARPGTVFGGPVDQIDAARIRRLVTDQIREVPDLDFKQQHYGNDREEKKKLAGDVAAMANTLGGVIVLGVRDEEEVAAECLPFTLTGDEERRMTQVLGAHVTPYVEVEILAIRESGDKGYYVLVVPPSVERPHAVVFDTTLRYPRRDGTTTRWLTEAEVAAMYRDRDARIADRKERVDRIVAEGFEGTDVSVGPWLTVTVVPEHQGRMTINRATRKEVKKWAGFYKRASAEDLTAGHLYNGLAGDPDVLIGMGTLWVGSRSQLGEDGPTGPHAELYADGSGYTASSVRARPDQDDGQVYLPSLAPVTSQLLRMLVAHATENCASFGTAIASVTLHGSNMKLVTDVFGGAILEDVGEGRVIQGPIEHRITISLDDVRQSPRELLSSTSNILEEIFHAFGLPEVLAFTSDGQIRSNYVNGDAFFGWAAENGIPVTAESVPLQ